MTQQADDPSWQEIFDEAEMVDVSLPRSYVRQVLDLMGIDEVQAGTEDLVLARKIMEVRTAVMDSLAAHAEAKKNPKPKKAPAKKAAGRTPRSTSGK